MIGVVVATHGRLAEELIRTAEGVVGALDRVAPASVDAKSSDVRASVKDAIRAVDAGEGVLLLTDLPGGSPTNVCLSFLAERKVEVITGVNLPMLLKVAALRSSGKPIQVIADELAEGARNSIGHVSEQLRRAL